MNIIDIDYNKYVTFFQSILKVNYNLSLKYLTNLN